jgi:SPP1 family predicted phage head-tail adaptor
MVTIQRYTSVSNGFGGTTQMWANHLEIDGVIDALSGNEQNIANQINIVASHVLICPVCDITESDRVIYLEKRYDVKFVDNPLNSNHHLEVMLEYKGVMQSD